MSSDDFKDMDLRGFDLDALDLEHIEFEDDDSPSPLSRWLVGILLLMSTVAMIWFPSSSLYPAQRGSPLSFAFTLGGVVVGLLSGRFLWNLLREMRARAPEERSLPVAPRGPAPAWVRMLTLAIVVAGAVSIIYATQSGAVGASGEAWFVSALGAIVVGIAMGRWLTMQAEVAKPRAAAAAPVQVPPWFKWVTLAVLVIGGLAVAFGPNLFPGNETLQVTLGGGGFVLGIAAAIWLARRFEEEEQRLKRRQRPR
ncbi:MAG: hypothetical protein AAFP04_05945 [Myxococcota bacterium]